MWIGDSEQQHEQYQPDAKKPFFPSQITRDFLVQNPYMVAIYTSGPDDETDLKHIETIEFCLEWQFDDFWQALGMPEDVVGRCVYRIEDKRMTIGNEIEYEEYVDHLKSMGEFEEPIFLVREIDLESADED